MKVYTAKYITELHRSLLESRLQKQSRARWLQGNISISTSCVDRVMSYKIIDNLFN